MSRPIIQLFLDIFLGLIWIYVPFLAPTGAVVLVSSPCVIVFTIVCGAGLRPRVEGSLPCGQAYCLRQAAVSPTHLSHRASPLCLM